MATKRVSVLAGGGDAPRLNSVIKSAVDRGNEIDWEEDRPGEARRSS
jgi:6-phosphofructokinase